MPSRSTLIKPDAQQKHLLPLPGDDDDEQQIQVATGGLKRKSAEQDGPIDKESRRQKKARKMAETNTKRKAAQESLDRRQQEELLNEDIAHMDGQLLGEHFARQLKRFEKQLSANELEQRRIPVEAIKDSSSFSEPRRLASLPAYLEQFSGRSRKQLSQAAEENGAPHTLVITASGIRAAEVTRALRVYQTKDAQVAKLFAKHIKLKEAIQAARKSRMHIGGGTPQRIIDLIEHGALTCERLERVVVDASALNQKQCGILDMAETAVPLSKLLAKGELRQGMEAGKVRVLFF